MRIGLLVRWSVAFWRCCPTCVPLWLCCGAGTEKPKTLLEKIPIINKSSLWSLHHDNNHLFKANNLLNLSCPRWYVGRGPDMMIVIAGDVLRTISIRLLKSLFSVSVCRSLVSLTPTWITTAATLFSSFRIAGICTETSRTRAPWKQLVCTLPLANVARMCRTIEFPMITASCSVSQRGAKRLQLEILKTGGGEVVDRGLDRVFRCCTQGPGFPAPEWRTSGMITSRVHGPVQRNTRSRGGGSVSRAHHTYPGLVSVSPGCFQHCFPFPQLGLLPKQLVDLFLHGLQLQLHRMQLEHFP